MWAKGDGDRSDLAAHANQAPGGLISYSRKHTPSTGGSLDIDIMKHKSGHQLS